MPKDTLARRMRIALAESDLKDFQVAAKAHVTAAWLGSVKQGQLKNPPTDKLRSVAKVLNKPTSYFTEPLGYIPIEKGAESPDLLAAAEAELSADTKIPTDLRDLAVGAIRMARKAREKAG
jgi:transcriptional regulator with XRE-family HTH domain